MIGLNFDLMFTDAPRPACQLAHRDRPQTSRRCQTLGCALRFDLELHLSNALRKRDDSRTKKRRVENLWEELSLCMRTSSAPR